MEIQENEEQLKININEAKLMDEENWIETTKIMENLKKLMKKFRKNRKKIDGLEMQKSIEEE